jgi:hypothetical protein
VPVAAGPRVPRGRNVRELRKEVIPVAAYSYQTEWWWRHGRPADVWVTNQELVAQFVKDHRLQPIPAEHFGLGQPTGATRGVAPEAREILVRPFPWPDPLPGYLRSPHLHFGGEIYVLDGEQWKEFSGRVMDGVREKLAGARTLGFEQMLELTNATSGVI